MGYRPVKLTPAEQDSVLSIVCMSPHSLLVRPRDATDAAIPVLGNRVLLYWILLHPSWKQCTVVRPSEMTQLEVRYRYQTAPAAAEMRAINAIREVYGIRKIVFDENQKIVRVEFDASRLKEPVVAGLLRRAGLDLSEAIALA